MALTLSIENETTLPDGGPLSVSITGKRGLDIGRDQHLDWTLPDPSRYVSGKHCEVRYKDGGYWLYDVSTNGTFLYGSDSRLKAPHLLRNGDRLVIGNYIIAVAIDGEEAVPPPRIVESARYDDLWTPTEPAAPPVERSQVRAPSEAPKPLRPDFLDWAADVPDSRREESAAPSKPSDSRDFDWARGAPRRAPPVEPPPAIPSPRRPLWNSSTADNPWTAPQPEIAREIVPTAPVPPPAFEQHAREPASPPASSQAAAPSSVARGDETAAAPAVIGNYAGANTFPQLVAEGAQVPADFFARKDPDELAREIGMLLRLVVENLRQLLAARLEAKRMARSASQTMIQALDNNPLKFSPTVEDALRIMFGPRSHSYLGAQQALEESFQNLKSHQIKTYAAMQSALQTLLADFDPKAIESQSGEDRGLAAMVGSRKARLWDAYVSRWQAKTGRQGGMVDAFMQYFADDYDRSGK